MGGEIKVVKSELDLQIQELGALTVGTTLKGRSAVVNQGYSDTADALNELFSELKAVETVMMEVLEQTKIALTKAGVQFSETDLAIGAAMEILGDTGLLPNAK